MFIFLHKDKQNFYKKIEIELFVSKFINSFVFINK